MTKSQSNLSQLRDFLGYLSTVKGDLSNVTAPPFVLSPRSVTEMPATWAERHELFLQPAREEDPARRALLVLKNFLCSQKRQAYAAATAESDGGAKKPLNAFLGELFLATVEAEGGGGTGDDDGGNAGSAVTQLISEQVSHHPPVTACCLYNRAYGMSSSGYVAQETRFSPASGVRVRQIGHAIIRDERHAESHLMTLPTLTIPIRGIATGSPYPELCGTCYIASSSGYLSTITFEGSRALGAMGARNRVRAVVTDTRNGGREVWRVEGQWNGRLEIKDAETGQVADRFTVDEVPCSELRTRAVEKQSPWESRRAWREVVEGIRSGDMRGVTEAKRELEEGQRELRTAEAEAGAQWPTLFFVNGDGAGGVSGSSQEFALLAQIIPDRGAASLEAERTAGVWRFIGAGAAEAMLAEGVFHRGLDPTGWVGEGEGSQSAV